MKPTIKQAPQRGYVFSTVLDSHGKPICSSNNDRIELRPIVCRCRLHGEFNAERCPECDKA